jgi:hypothetical protein
MPEFANKNIFQFHNGSALVWADPLILRRKLAVALGGDIGAVVKDVNADRPPAGWPEGKDFVPEPSAVMVAAFAADKFLAGIRTAFGMTPFDPATGEGADERCCLDAYDAWRAFEDSKKKPGETTPSTQPSSPAAYNQ